MHALLILAIVSITPHQVPVQASTTDSTVTVNLSNNVRVLAERATMYVMVEGTAETASAAMARVAARVTSVSDTLRALRGRVAAERPIPYSVVQLTANSGGYPPQPPTLSYSARTIIRITVLHIDDVAATDAAVLSAGAVSITGRTYEATSTDSIIRAGIATATDAARTTAVALAAAQGKKLGPIIHIDASSDRQWTQSPSINFDSRYSSSTGNVPEILVNARVAVQYRLLPVN